MKTRLLRKLRKIVNDCEATVDRHLINTYTIKLSCGGNPIEKYLTVKENDIREISNAIRDLRLLYMKRLIEYEKSEKYKHAGKI